MKIYEENKKMNQNKEQKLNKIDKDINLLKKDLLIKDENEFYNKIYNGQSLIFNNNDDNNIHIFKLKISRNNLNSTEPLFSSERKKNLKKIKV